jgi:hypothetical protein
VVAFGGSKLREAAVLCMGRSLSGITFGVTWRFSNLSSKGLGITRFRLTREALKDVPREEAELFLALGHLHNELTLFQRLVVWSLGAEKDTPEPHLQAQLTQTMIFLRYLGARMFEGWQTIGKDYFGRKVSKTYDADLSGVARQAYESIKAYDYNSGENPLKSLRNAFAFHSSGEDIGRGLEHLADETLDFYLGEAYVTSLFYASEVVLNVAILGTAEFDERKKKLAALVEEIVGQAHQWLIFIQGLMDIFLKRYPSVQEMVVENFNLLGLPNFEEVRIPWFTNTAQSARPAPNPLIQADT